MDGDVLIRIGNICCANGQMSCFGRSILLFQRFRALFQFCSVTSVIGADTLASCFSAMATTAQAYAIELRPVHARPCCGWMSLLRPRCWNRNGAGDVLGPLCSCKLSVTQDVELPKRTLSKYRRENDLSTPIGIYDFAISEGAVRHSLFMRLRPDSSDRVYVRCVAIRPED
jgi:hypothetical protein